MNKAICLVSAALILVATGCNEQKFKKDKDGTEYKLIRNSNGQKAVAGNFMEVNYTAIYKGDHKDSVLFSSVEASQPRFIPYDTVQLPAYFKEVNEGDSLVLRQSTDSIIKYRQGAPFMKKGEYIYQTFKIAKILPNKEAADSAQKTYIAAAKKYHVKKAIENVEKTIASSDSLVKADDKIIQDYMAKNNLKGTKTKWGTYVVIEKPGTGPMIGDTDIAVVNYTGRTFNDSTFDSNTDPKFGHLEPLYVDMSAFQLIPGWIDGLHLMQKGSKGKIIVPSYLGYGENGRPPRIAPNSNLVFDIDVADVVNQEAYQKEQEKEQNQMEQQRKMMEQMQRMQQQQQQQRPSAPPTGK
jgi:FKBP-type peptidyl-prolyl cis-trans isomerase FkpA